jgi:dTDP-glucose 4,6-dehydratase
MKLLVTGGAGFIGANFVREWLKNHSEDHVTVLDALTYAGNKKYLRGVDYDRLAFIRGSITNPAAVAFAMKDIDAVVHFAAESHVDRSITGPDAFLKTNVFGTHVLLEEARRREGQIVRFHHVSTDEVFGALEITEQRSFNETSAYAPGSPYAASKAASDHLCRVYFNTYGVPVTITNSSNNYGPYQHPEKFIPTVIMSGLDSRSVPVYGDGLYVRDWIHVIDHCRAIEAVMMNGKVGETYCVGGRTEKPNIEIVRTILEILNRPHSLISYVKDRPGHDRRYAVDPTKLERELGWRPRWSFADGLRETVNWYKFNRSIWNEDPVAVNHNKK